MKRILSPGQYIQVDREPTLKEVAQHIYLDTDNGMVYRIIDNYVLTMHGDLEFALYAEEQYLDMQRQQLNRDVDQFLKRARRR